MTPSREQRFERGLSKNKHFFLHIAMNLSVGLPELSYTNYRILIIVIYGLCDTRK